MTERIVAVLALWLACFAGTLQLQWGPVTTQCDGTPETMGTYEITLRKCNGDSLRLPPIPAQFTAADLEILDGTMGVAELRAVDAAGNRSCGYQSYSFAFPKLADPPPPPPDTSSTGITAHYYNGVSRGTWVATRRDTTIDFAWGLGSPMPGVNVDQFSVEWVGKIVVPTTGAWTFYINSEDGAQLFIDGTLWINRLVVQPLTEWSETVNLTAGQHNIQVEYMANLGNAAAHLSWSGPGTPRQVITRAALR